MNRGYQNLKQLESATVEAVEELTRQIEEEGQSTIRLINEEKRQRNTMATDQRTYVDAADNQVRRDAAALLDTFTKRSFWSRLNWLITGR